LGGIAIDLGFATGEEIRVEVDEVDVKDEDDEEQAVDEEEEDEDDEEDDDE
jgi:hypothetical protein